MTYRQSEMYNCAKYLKNLPLQSVSSRGNLQVVDIYIYLICGKVVHGFAVEKESY